MSLELYVAFAIACLVIVLVPGPTVTLIIASSMRHGTRAGLLNVAGTQLGVAMMIAVVGVGLTSMMEEMGHWFEWVRLIGAAYLIYIGWQMIRSGGEAGRAADLPAPRGGFYCRASWSPSATPRRCCSSAPSFRSSSIRGATTPPRSSSWA